MSQSNPQSSNLNQEQHTIIDIRQTGDEKHYKAVDVNIKSPKDKKDKWDNIRELIPPILGALVAIIVTVSSVITLNSPDAGADDKKNAQSLLSLIIGLTVGYVAGQGQASQKK